MGFFDALQKGVNSMTGGNYREIYFRRYPGPNYNCKACAIPLNKNVPREVTIDHIIPQKCGGTNAITNLQVLCQSCNSSKNAKVNELSLKYSGQALLRELKRVINY